MIDETLEAEYEQKHGHPSPIPFGFDGCVPKTKVSLPPQVETVKDSEESGVLFGDLRDKLRSQQKPGVCFPHDTCSSTNMTSDLEEIAMTQYTLKRGLKEFGNDGQILEVDVYQVVQSVCNRRISYETTVWEMEPAERRRCRMDNRGFPQDTDK